MSMSETIANTAHFFVARGCTVSETLTEAASAARKQAEETKRTIESEEQRIQNTVQNLVHEAVARETKDLHEAELRRRATLEKSWNETIQNLKSEIQQQVLDMSIQIAEIIIQRELPDQNMIRSILQESLSPISDLQGIRVRMHPDECGSADRDTDLSLTHGRSIEWMADPSLAPGDVVVESRNGIFDARIKERLATLREAIATPARHAIASKRPETGAPR